jgi:hypothetical protein
MNLFRRKSGCVVGGNTRPHHWPLKAYTNEYRINMLDNMLGLHFLALIELHQFVRQNQMKIDPNHESGPGAWKLKIKLNYLNVYVDSGRRFC